MWVGLKVNCSCCHTANVDDDDDDDNVNNDDDEDDDLGFIRYYHPALNRSMATCPM